MEKISANIYLIRGENDGRFPHSNSVLITDRVNVLIDVGCGLNKLKALIEEYPIDMVFYSHAHPDHCSGCGYFSSEIIWGPEEDSHRAGDLSLIAEKLLEPSLHDDYVAFITKTCGFKTFRPGHFFHGGEVFDFGTILMRAVYMPGHSYDHYCFYFPEERIMLSTDIDFAPFGPWYGSEESDIDQFIASINHMKEYDIQTLISSHRGVIRTRITEEIDRFLEIFHARDNKILDFLISPKSMDNFVEEALIYGKYPYLKRPLRYWESQMIGKHLKRLMARDLVTEKDGRFSRVFCLK